MTITEYIQAGKIADDLIGQIHECNYTAIHQEGQNFRPDLLTVISYPAWMAFLQTINPSLPGYPSYQPGQSLESQIKLNGSRFAVLDVDQFFFYTLCRNLPKQSP